MAVSRAKTPVGLLPRRPAARYCCAILLCCSVFAFAQASEYEVKAAFLLNFTKFIDWPPAVFAESGSPFNICVLGKDPFGNILDRLVEGEKVAGHPLTVRKIAQTPSEPKCQIIFIDESAKDVPQILKAAGTGTLTVGEGDRFIREGGMIAFVVENHRVRFDINRTAAEAAELKLSSRLLGVARFVQK